MTKVFERERDGVRIRGEDDEELLANVEHHVGDAHPDLVGKLSRDDVLAIAKEA